jgi:hypothetical protein
MTFDFMKPDIWDGLVIGVILIGLALAALQIYSDYTAYQRRQAKAQRRHKQPKEE